MSFSQWTKCNNKEEIRERNGAGAWGWQQSPCRPLASPRGPCEKQELRRSSAWGLCLTSGSSGPIPVERTSPTFCPVPWPSSGEGPGHSGSLGFLRRQAYSPDVTTVLVDTEWRAAAKVGTNLEMFLSRAQSGGHRIAEHKGSVLSSPEIPTPGSLGKLREIGR